jgi:hypothetical protein
MGMKIFLVLAVIFFALAFIAIQVPTVILSVGYAGWIALGLLSVALEFLLGWTTASVVRRGP